MSEESRMHEETVGMSRSDFLKAAGLGLGAAGLSAFMSVPVQAGSMQITTTVTIVYGIK